MTSSASADVIRRENEIANRHDLEAWVDCYRMDATNHGRLAGRDGHRQIFHSLVTAFPDLHFELREIVADGDRLMCEIIMSGTHLGTPDLPILGGLLVGIPPTEKRFTVQTIHFYRVDGDKIVEHRAVRDDLGIMQQLGLIASVNHAAGDISRLRLEREAPKDEEPHSSPVPHPSGPQIAS